MSNDGVKHSPTFNSTIRLAYPMILSGFAIGVINIFDTGFLGRVDELALNISNVGGIIYFMLIMISNGLGMGVQVLISRFEGKGDKSKVETIFNNGIALSLILGIVTTGLLYLFMPSLLRLFIEREDVVNGTIGYLFYRQWALIPAFLIAIYRAMLTSVNMNKILIYATFAMAVFNIVGDYLFIFGHYGFPKMGVNGAALISGLAELVGLSFVLVYTLRNVRRRYPKMNHLNFKDWSMVKSILKISNPLILQFIVSNSIWFCFFIMITNVGEREGAISNLVKGLFMFYMIPAWGYVQAVNSITSNLIGQEMKDKVVPYVKKSVLHISMLISGFSLVNLLFPETILSFLTNNESLIMDSVNVVRMLSGFVMFGSICSLIYNAYAGTGDTKRAMFVEIGSAIVYLLYVVYFIKVNWVNVEMVWLSEYVYWIVIGGACLWLFKLEKWKTINI